MRGAEIIWARRCVFCSSYHLTIPSVLVSFLIVNRSRIQKLIAVFDIHGTSTGFSGVERLQLHRYFNGNVNWRSMSAEEQRPETETDIDDAIPRPVLPRSTSMNDATRRGVSVCLAASAILCMHAC